jgi:hypothetical protein
MVWFETTIKMDFLYFQARAGTSDLRNKSMDGEYKIKPTVGGVLMQFVENAQRLPHLSV